MPPMTPEKITEENRSASEIISSAEEELQSVRKAIDLDKDTTDATLIYVRNKYSTEVMVESILFFFVV